MSNPKTFKKLLKQIKRSENMTEMIVADGSILNVIILGQTVENNVKIRRI